MAEPLWPLFGKLSKAHNGRLKIAVLESIFIGSLKIISLRRRPARWLAKPRRRLKSLLEALGPGSEQTPIPGFFFSRNILAARTTPRTASIIQSG
jgi:hypothetical protein